MARAPGGLKRKNECGHSDRPHFAHGRCAPCYHSVRQRDKLYGLEPGEFEVMLAAQGGRCAICKTRSNKSGRSLSVDHDHATGAVRGLLCANCNFGLGHFKDKESSLAAALIYLKSHRMAQHRILSQLGGDS